MKEIRNDTVNRRTRVGMANNSRVMGAGPPGGLTGVIPVPVPDVTGVPAVKKLLIFIYIIKVH